MKRKDDNMMDEVTDSLYKYVMNNNPDIQPEDIDEVRALNSHDLLIKFVNGKEEVFDTFANTSRRINHIEELTSEKQLRLDFRRRLQTIMDRRWVNQDELANRIGSSQQMISRYLTGQSIPNAITLKKIADALECTTDEFYEECI